MKIKKLFISLVVLTMFFSISIPLNNVSAKEAIKDEEFVADDTLRDDEVVTTVDENGNVLLLETVEKNIFKINGSRKGEGRSTEKIINSSTAVVNFRIYNSANTNTLYHEDGTNREGYTNGYYAADGAFLGYDNEISPTKVKFMQAGIVGWVDVNKVEVLNYTDSKVNTLSKYYVKNGKLYHGISTNLSNSSYSSSLEAGTAPAYLKEGYDYYSYDGHYFYEGSTATSYARMLNDYRNNRRTNAVNSHSPYYNYYQYLSHRSITTYNAEELNKAISILVEASENSYKRSSKLRNLGESFISNQNKYGTNALLMLAVAANESAWGCSNIAAQKNNLFGHAAYDSDPNGSANGYSSVEYSVYYHSAMFISKGYLDPVTDSRYYGANLGDKANGLNVKYASDPYWGEKGAAICWKIDNYLGSKDVSKYTIAIKDTLNTKHSIINIKSDANNSSNTLYSTYPVSSKSTYSKYAPSNYPFIVLKNGDKNNYYKIQSDGAVNSNRTGIIQSPSQSEYDFDKDYGYIPKSSVTVVCRGSDSSSNITNNQNTENTIGQPTGKGDNEPTLYYLANSQTVGWLDRVNEPNTAGTTGCSLDLYQIKIDLKNAARVAVLSGKVYSEGTWSNYDKITASTVIGNSDKALQLVNFNLINQAGYKLQYRVHSSDIGWQAWTDQGNNAGTIGKNIQAIDFRLVKDNSIVYKPSIYYQAHVSEKGWLDYVGDSQIAGTTGESLSLEAFKIGIDNLSGYQLTIKTYDKENGWVRRNNVNDGTLNGTEGKSLPLQAINAVLADNNWELQYRTHLSNLGWTDWTNQGETCGVTSGDEQIEAVMFRLVRKVEPAKITLNKTSLDLHVNSSEILDATVTPENTTNKTLIWTTSDSNIATVSTTGKVVAKSPGTAIITVRTNNGKTASCIVTVSKQVPSVVYQSHIEDIGWQSSKIDGQTSGTIMQSKRLEAIKINLKNNSSYSGSIQYKSHIEDIGWQDWKSSGELSGTSGQSKRLEAIQIRLTGDLSTDYSIYYRVHSQEFGWLGWAKDGECAGTSGYSYRLEAIQIKLVKKNSTPPVSTNKPFVQRYISYKSHIEDIGWQEKMYDGAVSGTTMQSKRLEAIQITLENLPYRGNVEYKTHIEDIGWQDWRKNGELSGTVLQSKRLEAIQIKLTDEVEKLYDIYYRVYVQGDGWLDWAKNGASAGTEGLSKRLEAIQIMLVEKNGEAPGNTDNSFIVK